MITFIFPINFFLSIISVVYIEQIVIIRLILTIFGSKYKFEELDFGCWNYEMTSKEETKRVAHGQGEVYMVAEWAVGSRVENGGKYGNNGVGGGVAVWEKILVFMFCYFILVFRFFF